MKQLYVQPVIYRFSLYLSAIIAMICLPSGVLGQWKYIQNCESGISSAKNNNLSQSVNYFTEAIQQKQRNSTAYCLRAYSYFLLKDQQKGIQDATAAISMDNNNPWPYFVRGLIYADQKNDDQAIADLTQAIVFEKEEGSLLARHALYMRANSYFRTGAYASAISDLNVYGAHPYENDAFQLLLAQSYLKDRRYAEGANAFAQIVQSDPQNKTALYYKGYCLLQTGDQAGAKSVMAQFREWNAQESELFANNPTGFFDLEKRQAQADMLYQEAMVEIRSAKETTAKALAYIQLYDAFILLDSAYQYLPAAEIDKSGLRPLIFSEITNVYTQLKEKPQIPEAARKYIVQALAATESKEYLVAQGFYLQAQQIAPWAPIIYNNLAFLMEKSSRFTEAIGYMETYILLSPNEKDTRSAQDKIYEWELKAGKSENTPGVTANAMHLQLMDDILGMNYVPGDYLVAMSFGGAFGYQANKNIALGEYWDNLNPTPGYTYSEKLPFVYSADAELIIKPWVHFGAGAFFKGLGGIGMHSTSLESDHDIGAFTINYGPFIRYYFPSKYGIAPLFFAQLGAGTSKMMGDLFIYTDPEYTQWIEAALIGSAPCITATLGLAGKSLPSSNFYVHLSLEYVRVIFDELEYEITGSSNSPEIICFTGTLSSSFALEPVTAIYSGIMLKMAFGFAVP